MRTLARTSFHNCSNERRVELALKFDNTQPLLIPLTQDTIAQDVSRITVHLAISDVELENAMFSLLGRNARFVVVKGSIGYAAESDVRLVDAAPNVDQQREFDELTPPKLLFIGSNQSDEAMLVAARAGAWALVSESADLKDLDAAIYSLVESTGSPLLRQIALSESKSKALLQEISKPQSDLSVRNACPNPLSPREIEILDLIARGEPSNSIGDVVGLAEQTVKNYVVRILEKTRTHNRAHAAALAAQRGWLLPLDSM